VRDGAPHETDAVAGIGTTPKSGATVVAHSGRRLFRDALVAWLGRQQRFAVVGQAADVAELPRLCALRTPDLVLVDGGIDVVATLGPLTEIREGCGRTRIIVICDELPAAAVVAARRAGVDALVPGALGLEALLSVLRQQSRGPRSGVTVPAPGGLTPREREILSLLGAGHPARRIAAMLGSSVGAVENSKRHIYAKLNVATQCQAVARAAALGLVPTRRVPVRPDRPARVPELTAREADILRSIAMGHSVRETAAHLAIAEKTVENTQARLFLKLGTHNRAGAIGAAHGLGILDQLVPGA
jgi:DNA-binding NarL/FixJ family response regulator